jgi:hypothetical protein
VIPRSDRSIGDLLLAFGRLRPRNARTREAIARRLGFVPPAAKAVTAKRRTTHAAPAPAPIAPTGAPPAPSQERQARTPLEPQTLPEDRNEMAWLSGESLAPADPRQIHAPLPYQPLLPPGHERGVIFYAVATIAETGPVDIERLVKWLADGKPIAGVADLPRLQAPSLFQGVDVLIDLAEAMEPYGRDQRELVERLRRLVGPASLRVMQFRGCPVRGAGPGPAWTWRPYLSPNGHRPALVLGGIGSVGIGPAGDADVTPAAEWARLGRAFARKRVPLVLLTPYVSGLPSVALRRDIAVVHWDRSTSVSTVRRARHRVAR